MNPPQAEKALWKKPLLHGGVLLSFAVLAVVHTWPLATHLKGFMAGGTDDTWMNTWWLSRSQRA